MNTAVDDAVADAPDAAPGIKARWLDTPAQLAPLLLRACELRVVIAVGTPGGGARNSLLLGVDLIDQRLLIDPPHPPMAVEGSLETRLALATRIDGGALDFIAEVEGTVDLDGEPALKLHWPERARFMQRRSAYRLNIPREFRVPPVVFRNQTGPFAGTLVDLSRFGAGALVPLTSRAREGDRIACSIRVADAEFTAEAEVRSCVKQLDRLRMGLKFERITPMSAAKLSAAVAQLERAVLRRVAERRTRLG